MVQKAQWPIWESIRLIIVGPGFNSHQSFGQCLNFLANLTNLTNLSSRNLGKTQLTFLFLQKTSVESDYENTVNSKIRSAYPEFQDS